VLRTSRLAVATNKTEEIIKKSTVKLVIKPENTKNTDPGHQYNFGRRQLAADVALFPNGGKGRRKLIKYKKSDIHCKSKVIP